MRIGILTFHCAYNYGAVLQCYALQKFLLEKGHDVRVIDYRPTTITGMYKLPGRFDLFRKNFLRAIAEVVLLRWQKIRNTKFEEFINSKLNLASTDTIISNPYDVIIVGSDQVWNYQLTNGFDKYYWGQFVHPGSTKIISYAASMHDSWPSEISLRIKQNLESFDEISVREVTLAKKLRDLMPERSIYQVVDPTLLLGKDAWKKIAISPKKKSYLLLFQVERRNPRTEKIAIEIAKRRHLKIVNFLTRVDRKTSKIAMTVSPEEFVGWFECADFVVCSSFHGTVFSIIFNRPFVSVRMGDGKDNRVASLLSSLGLDKHYVDELDSRVDYNYSIDDFTKNGMLSESVKFINKIG